MKREKIVELGRQTDLDEVNVQDLEEILQERVRSFSKFELKELVLQGDHKNIESSDSVEE